jgi:hypothetical protein
MCEETLDPFHADAGHDASLRARLAREPRAVRPASRRRSYYSSLTSNRTPVEIEDDDLS